MRKLFTFTLFLLLAATALRAQGVGGKAGVGGNGGFGGGASGAPPGPTAITINYGGAAEQDTVAPGALKVRATPFMSNNLDGGTISSCSVWIASAAAANWGCAIYNDEGFLNANNPPGSLLCSAFSSSTPSAGWNTLSLSGCGTLQFGYPYWVAYVSVSGTQQQGQVEYDEGGCPGTLNNANAATLTTFTKTAALASFTSTASWPSTFGAGSASVTNCASAVATVAYTDQSIYDYGVPTMQGDVTDNGNALLMISDPIMTSGQASPVAKSCSVKVGSPAAANWGCAIYNDNAGVPDTLNCSAFSSTTPSAGFNTLTLTGCSLSPNTQYWVTMITASNTQQQVRGASGGAGCPFRAMGVADNFTTAGRFKSAALGSFTSNASWPSSYGASTASTLECWEEYATVSYSGSPFNIIQMGEGYLLTSPSSLILNIFPMQAGHSLIVGVKSDTSRTITSFADSATDTISSRGTCSNGVTGGDVTGAGLCIGSVDRATTATNSVSVTMSGNSATLVFFYMELAGTASSSFDTSEYDGSFSATPFTSGNTGTTANASEFAVGLALNAQSPGTFTAGTNWTQQLYVSTSAGTVALFTRTLNSTGTYNLTGTFSSAGTLNLPGLVTFK